jgi:ATP phosphoribosyltransferase regulatory subunit
MHSNPATGPSRAATVRLRRHMVNQALQILDGWGYDEADVPLLSPYEQLRGAVGNDVDRELFRFVDRSGELLYLRGDITPTLAWKASQGLDAARLPLRLSYANRVARVQRDFAREELESFAVGFELVGVEGRVADLEVLTVAIDLLESLGVADYDIQLGHVRLAGGLIDAHLSSRALRDDMQQAMVRRDAWRVGRVCEQGGIDADVRRTLETLCRMNPGVPELEELTRNRVVETAQAAGHLKSLLQDLSVLQVADRVRLDLSAVGERSYYTGIQFRISADSWGTVLGSGGRYDDLYGHFGAAQPAVGFGLRMDHLVRLMSRHAQPATAPMIDVMPSDDSPATDLNFARQARRAGERVTLRYRNPERENG